MRRRRRDYIVEAIPNDVWELLDHDEKALLFLIEDRLVERFGNAVFQTRLAEQRKMRRVRQSLDEFLPLP